MMKKKRKKHPMIRLTVLCLMGMLTVVALIFMRFGGFGTGENASPEEFAAYAGTIEDITIPEQAQIIALGEATHGECRISAT
jgi:erythromycin esterase